MAETNRISSANTPDTAGQEGAVFIRTEYEKAAIRNVISRSITTTEAVQTAIIEALKDMGIEINQPDEAANSYEQINDSPNATQTVSVQKANTDGIPSRLQVEPPLSPDQIADLGAAIYDKVRLYEYSDKSTEPVLVEPTSKESQIGTEQIEA